MQTVRSNPSFLFRAGSASGFIGGAVSLLFFSQTALAACTATAGVCSHHPQPLSFALPSTPHTSSSANRYAAGAKTLLSLANGQSTIVRHFPAAMGLNGYVVQIGKARDVLMYTSRDGKHFFLGGIFRANGQNLSKVYAQKYLPSADLAPASPKPSSASVYAGIQKTTWFTVGNPAAPKVLWAVMDPNCIFCHLAVEHLLPYLHKGEVQLRIVPVGFLKPSSLPKAVTILASHNPAKAWTYDEQHFQVQAEEGGIVPETKLQPEIRAEVLANWDWANRNGYYGTPLIVWENAQGKAEVQDGMPLSMKALVGEIGKTVR